jgi:hypothetical protein
MHFSSVGGSVSGEASTAFLDPRWFGGIDRADEMKPWLNFPDRLATVIKVPDECDAGEVAPAD